MSTSVRHGLPQEEALSKIKGLLESLKSEFSGRFTNLDEQWFDNRGNFSCLIQGMAVSGSLTVTSSEVRMSGSIPFAAIPFRGKIQDMIRQRLEALLVSPQKPRVKKEVHADPVDSAPLDHRSWKERLIEEAKADWNDQRRSLKFRAERRYEWLDMSDHHGYAVPEEDEAWYRVEKERRHKEWMSGFWCILVVIVIFVAIMVAISSMNPRGY